MFNTKIDKKFYHMNTIILDPHWQEATSEIVDDNSFIQITCFIK